MFSNSLVTSVKERSSPLYETFLLSTISTVMLGSSLKTKVSPDCNPISKKSRGGRRDDLTFAEAALSSTVRLSSMSLSTSFDMSSQFKSFSITIACSGSILKNSLAELIRFGANAVCSAPSTLQQSDFFTLQAYAHSNGTGTPVVYSSRIRSLISHLVVMPTFTRFGINGLVRT